VFAEQTYKTQEPPIHRRMDYVCYEEPVDTAAGATKPPLMAIEVKRKGVYDNKEKRTTAMAKTVEYANLVHAPIACVTDGVRWWYNHAASTNPGGGTADLTVEGQTMAHDVVISPEIARGFRDNSDFVQPPCTGETAPVPAPPKQLLVVFREANELLRELGLPAGQPRISELCRWLFLRLTKLKPNGGERTCWENLFEKTGEVIDNPTVIADQVLISAVIDEYGPDGFKFAATQIKNTPQQIATVRKLVTCLNEISSDDCSDQAGQAFEYLLSSASNLGNDFGEYYTPRDVTKAVASMISRDLKPGDRVFDPFCGTGGFLTSVFSELVVKPEFLTSDNRTTLKKDTFFGIEAMATAEIAKMNFILRGDGHSGIVCANTFDSYAESDPAKEYVCPERYSTVVTNVPFGVAIPPHPKGAASERYCVLRCLAAVEAGGRAVLIVSSGIMTRTAPADSDFRRSLWSRANVELVVKLPKGTFDYTGVESYMIYATDVRQEARGNDPEPPMYLEWNKTDQDLSKLLAIFREKKHSLEEHGFQRAGFDSNDCVVPLRDSPQGSCLQQLLDDKTLTFTHGTKLRVRQSEKSTSQCSKWRTLEAAEASGRTFFPVFGGGRTPKAYHDTPSPEDEWVSDRLVVRISTKGTAGHVAMHRANEIFAADGCSLWWSNDQEQIMTEFLYIALRRENLPQYSRGSGAPTLTAKEVVERVGRIEFPSLDEQREQVERLRDTEKLCIKAEKLALEGREKLRELLATKATRPEGFESPHVSALC
jgi:type I restriction enzyme M protein